MASNKHKYLFSDHSMIETKLKRVHPGAVKGKWNLPCSVDSSPDSHQQFCDFG